jgi:hypothetical protein
LTFLEETKGSEEMKEQIERMKKAFDPYDWTLSVSIKSWRDSPEYTASVTLKGEYFLSINAESLKEAVDEVLRQVHFRKEYEDEY